MSVKITKEAFMNVDSNYLYNEIEKEQRKINGN